RKASPSSTAPADMVAVKRDSFEMVSVIGPHPFAHLRTMRRCPGSWDIGANAPVRASRDRIGLSRSDRSQSSGGAVQPYRPTHFRLRKNDPRTAENQAAGRLRLRFAGRAPV